MARHVLTMIAKTRMLQLLHSDKILQQRVLQIRGSLLAQQISTLANQSSQM